MSKQEVRSFQQIWRQMDPEQRRAAAEALCAGAEYARVQQTFAGVIAAKLHMRPQKAAKLPAEKSAAYLASISDLNEQMAGAVVRAYLFARHEPMLAMFLDELQIPHKHGVISADKVTPPSADSLHAAVERIRAAFAAADVQMYLSALLASDPVAWANLAAEEAAFA